MSATQTQTMDPAYTWEIETNKIKQPLHLSGCYTLEEVKRKLLVDFPDWFVYRGAHHVALHRASGKARLVLIVEKQ